MPNISKKGLEMPASPIRKLTPYADKAKAEGKKVYHLNIGQPDIPTPKEMLDAVKSIDFDILAYTASEGTATYREKLAGYYNNLNYNITPTDILVTVGGSEALTIGLLTCVGEGEEIIIPEPFYANYNSFAKLGNITIKPVLSNIDNGFALPPIADFEAIITEKTRAIVICNPNNPTGYLYSRSEIEELKILCKKHDLFLFSDEAYREFCYDSNEFVSPMHLADFDENVVVVDTVSKRYSACGARLGCLISKNKQVMQAALKFAQARLSPGMIEQIAATAAIDTPSSYFEAVNNEYTLRRNTLVERLNAMDGVFCPKPRGAFYVVAKLPVDDTEKFCQWILENFEHEGQTVMLAPAGGFYSDATLGKKQVRLAYVLNTVDINHAMDCVELALKQYPGREI